MEDSPDISWGCNIDSVENATSLQRWLTNSGFPPKKMVVDSVDIREREECAQLTSQCAHLQDRTMALAKELASLKLVSDISLEEVDVLKLAFFENNAKDKRYNRHTRFVSCDIVVSAYIGLWFRPIYWFVVSSSLCSVRMVSARAYSGSLGTCVRLSSVWSWFFGSDKKHFPSF
ncbi:unnamed protein product [Brassica oleracea]